MAVYDAVMAFVVAIVREADYPSGEIEVEFLQAQRKASFLFGQPVVDAIDEVWRNGADFQLVKRTMTHLFDTTGDYGSGNVQKEHDLMVWFGGRLTALPTIFRAEMSVS